jgi:L-fuconolactonase
VQIVDAQVHLNLLGSMDTGLAAMEAAGVGGCLIDEWHGQSPSGKFLPGEELANGAVRTLRSPIAEDYATRWPERFSYYGRTDPLDPDLEHVMAQVLSRPGCRCLRVFVHSQAELALFESGGYAKLFEAAAKRRIPCFVWLGGKIHLLTPYVEKFPNVPFVIDHCGLGGDSWPGPDVQGEARFSGLTRTYALAAYPNVALKWSQAVRLSAEPFPFADLIPWLLRTIERFSLSRVMWGSDYTQLKSWFSWADCHSYIRASKALSDGDKEWILGRSLRQTLKWPT